MHRILITIFAAATLAACGTASTLVDSAYTGGMRFDDASISAGTHTVPVDGGAVQEFESRLRERIIDSGMFTEQSGGLTIEYRFLAFNSGNRMARYFWGGIGNAGEASTTIEVVFRDASGEVLSRIQSEGRIDSGFFGGSANNAVTRAADEVAEYTITTFNQ
ncbi:DUF4410 domain-containing protein [Hyphobacterium sp.]|uniref:DUF4410 domain-containing protein n=1 Tax=Hyphobacterium sp. TaxID=2004662 RepID=UPI003BAA85BD